MDVRIYKINTGITGRNFSSDKRSNFLIGGKTNSFYSIGNLMRGIEDFYLEGNLYFIDKEEELITFHLHKLIYNNYLKKFLTLFNFSLFKTSL